MCTSKNKKTYDDDDGRVIAPMNVDGMPWYDERQPKTPKTEGDDAKGQPISYRDMTPEEKKEYRKDTRFIVFGVLKYLIPLIAVFVAAFTALICLMVFVWFK